MKRSSVPWSFFFLFFLSFSISCSGKSVQVAAAPVNDSLSFIVLGDWGWGGEGHQQAIARQMSRIGKKFNTSFIITTGDNFYDVGVSSIRDSQWTISYENIYTQRHHQVDWYPVLGNHDYGTNPQAQVEYSSISKRWKMPARYYTVEKRVSGTDSALFLFTDTSPFVNAYHGHPMADLQQQDTAAQLRWLKESLGASGHKWKIVVGHHPFFSSGEHGNTLELMQRFGPVFSRFSTDFYLCGHDHILEHISLESDPIQFLISGGGGAETYKVREKNPISRFARSSPGFLVMTLYTDRANFYFFNDKGKLLYGQQVAK